MGKIRYVCTSCGNGFTTRSAAQRHLANIERGNGMVVSEASYRTGLTTGLFFPVLPHEPPRYEKKPVDPASKAPMIEAEEFTKGFWRRAGELFCEDAFRDENRREILKMSMQIHLMEATRKFMTRQVSE